MVSTERPCGVGGQEAAGADRLSVEEHRAGTAHLHVAGALGARQAEPVAQDVKEELLRLDLTHHGAR